MIALSFATPWRKVYSSSTSMTFSEILLELLMGKVIWSKGFDIDIAKRVQLVVREEWAVEVIHEALISEGGYKE